ncbi:zf-DNL-domain-containing protein [Aulographum hederae CBS 113979]|uniref:Zf-DNL-domain-containing protein n=1 Tax=Aulographum hederae CBS 113979 TaxID=1176131 RepID=A0A6G1GU25_9PEZI|nr:zf-DNL-domain-containing protein [Aulographum hederae CBS 113979]
MSTTRPLTRFARLFERSFPQSSSPSGRLPISRFHQPCRQSLRPRLPQPLLSSRPFLQPQVRLESSVAVSQSHQASQESQQETPPPAYQMTFTCKKCDTRSSHRVTKQGYHKGTVLISCPGCKARHLMADHLKIFSDKSITIEDIMKSKGEVITKGTKVVGDVEFWEDGTVKSTQEVGETAIHPPSEKV